MDLGLQIWNVKFQFDCVAILVCVAWLSAGSEGAHMYVSEALPRENTTP